MTAPALPERTPIPDPLPEHGEKGPRVVALACPDCERRFGAKQRARYELHWRLSHDVRRAL